MENSVGEEVMQWAEKCWLIEHVCKKNITLLDLTSGSWEVFREAFINTIDKKIEEKINNLNTR